MNRKQCIRLPTLSEANVTQPTCFFDYDEDYDYGRQTKRWSVERELIIGRTWMMWQPWQRKQPHAMNRKQCIRLPNLSEANVTQPTCFFDYDDNDYDYGRQTKRWSVDRELIIGRTWIMWQPWQRKQPHAMNRKQCIRLPSLSEANVTQPTCFFDYDYYYDY